MTCQFGRKVYGIALACGTALVFSGSIAQAANNNSATIPLSGTVATTCTVANNATGATTTFTDMTTGASSVLIGTITEICNDKNGYKVTLTESNYSASSPSFKGSSTNTLIPYSLSYNGSAVSFPSSTATLTPAGTQTSATGVAKALNITFAASLYTADTYSDTITITMASQ
jgi:hypothetical protein